jgi:leucyl aminopeptidase
MKVTMGRAAGLARERAPLLALLLSSDDPTPKWLTAELKGVAKAPVSAKDFTGKELESVLLYRGAQRVLLVGLGEGKKLKAETLRRAAGAAARRARALKVESIAIALAAGTVAPYESGRATAEGVQLGGYAFHGEKTEKPQKPVRAAAIHWIGRGGSNFAAGLRVGTITGRAQCLARDLGNQPANVATPTWLASQAAKTLRGRGVRMRVLRKAELERRGFGGVTGVARGSHEPPVFMEFEWRPRSFKKTACLIGKGLTFDSGGISLKPAANMEEMKFDMCGGAAVIGAFAALAELRPKVRVVGLVPSTENMPGGSAIKPGDVLKTYGGISVEVVNTDAEGRLILADALGRAKEFEPDFTVDLATLTGACVVALGHRASGLFCADEDFTRRLREAGEAAGERLWPLPLWDEYLEEMKSPVADVKNSGSRFGGAVTAAAFLKKFAGDLNWAHLDIAGTAWDTPRNELYEGGASGVGVRTLVRFIEGLE